MFKKKINILIIFLDVKSLFIIFLDFYKFFKMKKKPFHFEKKQKYFFYKYLIINKLKFIFQLA
ncbi:MAG: hypothetical protein EAZ20_06095 [Bacteroidetes bacterium]|nr:MAG: hypothetical protein EAZ20_06095 [Bacteroidota bacterium]